MIYEILGKFLILMPATLAMALFISTEAIANQISSNIENQPEKQPNISSSEFSNFNTEFNSISEPSNLEENSLLDQVTSVSQLSDIKPTDWAFQALQSLVERYGCIAGYPDGTYRKNRAMTRYEFAAGLNACLERINEIIGSNTNNLAKKEDLIALQKLQEEFAAELATLRGRVNALESRTSELEANQFSTTTKLYGNLVTYLGDAFGKNASPANSTTFNYQLYLNLVTSFTGKDSLIVALQGSNVQSFDSATNFPSGRLSGRTDETVLTSNSDGDITLDVLQYTFPVGDKIFVSINAFNSTNVLSSSINKASNNTTGFVSTYARFNPLTGPISLESGVGVSWDVSPWLKIDISVGSEFGSGSNPTKGLFNGGYGMTIRPVIKLGRLNLTAFYIHTYSPEFGIDTGTGSNASKLYGVGPVVANTYLGGISYLITPTIDVGGSIAYSHARALGSGTRGDADIWTYNFGVSFYDVGKKGNTASFLVGIQPRLAGTSNQALAAGIGLPAGQRKDRNAGLHIEAYYAHRLTDNIIITPAFIWLTAPNNDQRNPDVFLGLIRTTFDF